MLAEIPLFDGKGKHVTASLSFRMLSTSLTHGPFESHRWDQSAGRPSCAASYEGHIDWVNDIALVNDLLVSCSSDRTVKVWKADKGGFFQATQLMCQDYLAML